MSFLHLKNSSLEANQMDRANHLHNVLTDPNNSKKHLCTYLKGCHKLYSGVYCIYHYIVKQIWYKGYSVYHSNVKRGTVWQSCISSCDYQHAYTKHPPSRTQHRNCGLKHKSSEKVALIHSWLLAIDWSCTDMIDHNIPLTHRPQVELV